MALGQLLHAVANNLKDVCAAAIGGHLELLVETRELVLALDRGKDGLGHEGLGLPGTEGGHDGAGFLVRVDGALVLFVLVRHRGVGVQSSLYRGLAATSNGALRDVTYSAAWPGSSFDRPQGACHMVENGLRQPAWRPCCDSCM